MDLETLDTFVGENPFLSAILLAIVGNLATDLLKKLYYSSIGKVKSAVNGLGEYISKCSVKNIEFIIKHYETEIEEVKKLKLNYNDESFKLLKILFSESTLISIIVIVSMFWYLFLQQFQSQVLLYAFIAVSSKLYFQLFSHIIYNLSLFRKATFFDAYKGKTERKIQAYKKLL